MDRDPISGVQRRVAGWHDVRMDGISDLLLRAQGASVLDVGCNRGMVGFEFACNGARLVHGCDNYEDGIKVAREVFADVRKVESRFEVVDLTKGPGGLEVFGGGYYDAVLYLGTHHKLVRVMKQPELASLVTALGRLAFKYFAWRGNMSDLAGLDEILFPLGLQRVHLSELSDLGPAAIWKRMRGA